jgi:hypothetical protein
MIGTMDELKGFLGKSSDIIWDKGACNQIERMLRPVEQWMLKSLVLLFSSQM